MQKWADKEGSSALAVWKGFVFVLVFEFSVATRHIHDNLEKITFSTNIWTFPELMTNTEITYILQNLQLDCRIYPSIVVDIIIVLEDVVYRSDFVLHLIKLP